MIHKYKGYTGEESAFSHLKDSGHTLEVPASGTEAGHDAAVHGPVINGEINVKVTDPAISEIVSVFPYQLN